MRRKNSLANRKTISMAESDIVNPLETVANLSDVMLVIAVALMLVIVAHWDVDLTDTTPIEEEELELIEAKEVEFGEGEGEAGKYEEFGKVYMDVETGELYVVRETSSDGEDD